MRAWVLALVCCGGQTTPTAQTQTPVVTPKANVCAELKATTCVPFARGAWVVASAPPNELGPRWVVAIQLDGKHLASKKTLDDLAMLGAPNVTSLASDYDGDGIPELYVHTSAPDPETGGHVEAGALFTASGGNVDVLPGASRVRDMGTPVDVDGDGLLDLPTSNGVRLSGDVTCKTAVADWKPARFVAHARRDGTFSLDDDVAKKFALGWCPSAPRTIASPSDAVCAHLWSARAEITCTPWDCKADAQGKAQLPTAARDCAYRRLALEDPIPFTLR